jgi:hypothetical protein
MPEGSHLGLTRRGFLGASAAALAASALPCGSYAQYPQSAKYRRWEITDPNMPATVLTSYKTAVRAMLKLPATDPRNWYRNAFVHLFDCPHGNWWFLPWHRGYLGWFERACRELSGDQTFALPYWDWTKTQRVPAAMFDDVLDPNNAAFIATFDRFKQTFDAAITALYPTFTPAQRDTLARRDGPLSTVAEFWTATAAAQDGGAFFEQPNARGLTAANPDLDPLTRVAVSLDMIRSSLRTPAFSGDSNTAAGFGSNKTQNHNDATTQGILESEPHNNVHGALGAQTGGFMWAFLSPVDPIFFLHHGNIDRLWDVWTRRQQARNLPTLPEGADLTAWSNEQFLFFSDEKGQPVTKTKASDYATTSAFEYDYSPGTGEDMVAPEAVAVAARPATQQFSARLSAQAVRSGERAGGVVEVPAAALAARAPDASPTVAEVTLDLADIEHGRRFQVLVTPPGGGNPIVAGAITPFGHRHGQATFTVPLDIRVVPVEGTAPPVTAARRSGPPPTPQVTAIRVRAS